MGQQEAYESIASQAAVRALFDSVVESGGLFLSLDSEAGKPEPVVLMDQHPGESLVMDLSSVDYLLSRLQGGEKFVLSGQTQGKMFKTPPLSLTETRYAGSRFLCCSDYPESVEVLQRREAFRAELRLGMVVTAEVIAGERSVTGELRDLSQSGCQVELPLAASTVLDESQLPLQLTLGFPNGAYFEVAVISRHQHIEPERHLLRVGFEFAGCSSEQERQIWYFVCETERESSRYQKEEPEERQTSPLYQSLAERLPVSAEHVGRREIKRYATPVARRLVKVAAFLNAQMLLLQQGSDIDARQLSRNADRILLLHEEDREALLFATRCLSPEPLLVRHGIAVAVFLLDLVAANMPREAQKAVVASGLVHDLGKVLVPQVVYRAPTFEATHRQAMSEHVALLLERLKSCQWLSKVIAQAVIGGVNERLDGSGYPSGLTADDLNELAKASAVIDVVEAMRRDRADRPAKTVQEIYRHLLSNPHQFDQRWIKRYIDHFKSLPIGSLVCFTSGQMGWVVRLEKDGGLEEVILAPQAEPPMSDTLGKSIRGDVLQRLGKPARELAVSA